MKVEKMIQANLSQGAAIGKTNLDIVGMDDATTRFAVLVFAALAHPTRLKIIEFLADQERTVAEVAERLEIHQPNASQHLAILDRAGVVKSSRAGALHCYSLRGPRIAQVMRLVNEFRAVHAPDLRDI